MIFTDICDMMYENNIDEVFIHLEKFCTDQADQDTFISYFEQQQIKNDLYKQWVHSFQEDMFRHIEANMFIESFHNQLKTIYL